MFSRLAPDGRIFAFEPTETIDLLRTNLEHHHCANVIPLQVALGRKAGVYEEDIYRIWGEPPERQPYTFSTIDATIDELELDRLDCIKIDVDSFDFDVLRGAEKTLKRFNPWVIVELNHALSKRNQSVPEALEWLYSIGYSRAHVTDYENYVLKRYDGESAPSAAPAMLVEFESRPMLLPHTLARGEALDAVFVDEPAAIGSASVVARSREPKVWCITAPGPQWSYAASWLRSDRILPEGPVIIEADVEVSGGAIGASCVKADNATFVCQEAELVASPGKQTLRLTIAEADEIAYLVVRNVDPSGEPALANVHAIRVYTATEALRESSSTLLVPAKKRLSLTECEAALRGRDIFDIANGSTVPGIAISGVEELGTALGFSRAFVPQIRVYDHGLADFKTEIDESAIFSYLYREFQPARHLEFGTWEGWGAVLCAQASNAEIWTINLPEGERDADGKPVYDAGSDSGQSIGWRYRAAGFGSRVHQILCDSRKLEVHRFGPEFFDSVFIDGGHTKDVVTSDTDKALAILRSGGLIIWHDFCPDVETLAQNEAPRGVVGAVIENFSRWSPALSSWFWVRPSWILIGVKA